jgi:hypothetical protein
MANQNQPNPQRKDRKQFDGGKSGNRQQEQEQGGRQRTDQFPGEQRRQQEDQRSQGQPRPDADREERR